tara:strand:- start:12203 stop:12568 length:366 start_codon:yes stop_codon:yes gene_type:complete
VTEGHGVLEGVLDRADTNARTSRNASDHQGALPALPHFLGYNAKCGALTFRVMTADVSGQATVTASHPSPCMRKRPVLSAELTPSKTVPSEARQSLRKAASRSMNGSRVGMPRTEHHFIAA